MEKWGKYIQEKKKEHQPPRNGNLGRVKITIQQELQSSNIVKIVSMYMHL